ncbi:GNAT family N-acetyltransferase [Cellulomonas composti]|uniref:Putative acetyltransferase, GNAT n=1 Tax=Cellulomonas composti TaxID=266130 RepID=A0A511J7U4_9CELL|nr:GNAT family N-acetyltransferase [Cellulomonas composti]GEL93789.1 putative acetyltransferase, GNAT [Cellulomonas composti]
MTTTLAPLAERVAAPATVRVPDASTGLTWGALARSDVAELTALVVACQEADALPYRISQAEVDEHFDDSNLDVERDTLAGRDEAGALRAWALVQQPAGDTRVVRAFLDGGVHPEWRRRGIGAQVLAWSQDRGRQLLAATGKQVPARLSVYVDDTATATAAAVRAAGFTPIRYYAEMRRALTGDVPEPFAPEGVRIVPWSAELDEQARLAHNEAFADHWGSEPRTPEQWVQTRAMFAPTWSFLALDQASDEVVGYLLSGRYEQDWPVAGYSSGYTDVLGVRRAWRGRGIAPALLVAAMHAYRADGIEYAELGVDTANPTGAHGLYSRLGYVPYLSSTAFSIEL